MLASVLSIGGCSTLGIELVGNDDWTEQTKAVVAASPVGTTLPRELDKDVLPGHYLIPGDVLVIEPVKLDSIVRLPADQRVLADGTVDLGGYGRVVVAGSTLEVAEALIERTIYDRADPSDELELDDIEVNVRLIQANHRYYVLGEVNSPGIYEMRGFETVLDGILEAGGLTSGASTCDIILTRPTGPSCCRVTLPVCYREITQLGDAETNYQLRPGDRIVVASRGCCDDLCFWRGVQTCQRCCKCQTACADPALAASGNPMSRVSAVPVPNVPTAQVPVPDAPMIGPDVSFDTPPLRSQSSGAPTDAPQMFPPPPGTKDDSGTKDNLDKGENTETDDVNRRQRFDSMDRLTPPNRTDNGPQPTLPELLSPSDRADGELQFEPGDFDLSPRQSSRFRPMRLR